ncbi:acyl-CoA thioesterase [Sinosporangium siamense]|uniref:Acyl-CoA thioester hydrolase n=1 Tax=Sinosporangium siamense TaxID=1367973 RepID=A0A919VB12_9ACTN|nr:thioesterase family protein [Sinosporangium siamense]GII91654.1 hypothetical protein Ssi02_18850 [Sinosporangium siamense]
MTDAIGERSAPALDERAGAAIAPGAADTLPGAGTSPDVAISHDHDHEHDHGHDHEHDHEHEGEATPYGMSPLAPEPRDQEPKREQARYKQEQTHPQAPEGGQPHLLLRQVRFADIDSLGHVNNVRFLDYLEDARMALLYVDPAQAGGQPYRGFVVLKHEIHYRRPLTLRPDPVTVETWVSDLAGVTFTFHHEIRDDTEVFVRASTAMAAYNAETAKPRRLSPDERAYLRKFAVDRPSR